MKLLRLVAIAAAVSLAACSSSPTDSVRAGAPSFDGGNMLGTGNYTGGDGPGMIGNGNEGQGLASDTTTTSTERGGGGLGSGN
jgi:hypothetical protein